jgi:hypothetical protein
VAGVDLNDLNVIDHQPTAQGLRMQRKAVSG